MLVAFDKAIQQGPGAPVGNRNAAKATETTVDNIHSCQEPARAERPAGTSAQAAIRRLRKAADAGGYRRPGGGCR